MLDASFFAPYIGFTESEVKDLCKKYNADFEEVKRWYDGYSLEDYHVYNPKTVVSVLLRKKFQSYWSRTGTYETILPLINLNFDGLKNTIVQMISGAEVYVDVSCFQNDMVTFTDKNDVLTLLIHLGYLAYNAAKCTAFIPNEEVRQEFVSATRKNKWNELIRFQMKSEEVLNATLDMDNETVAKTIDAIHTEFTSAIKYNDENSLSSVITISYLSAMQYYFIPIREMSAGRGFADYVFLPKPEYRGEIPALVVELKWNQSAVTALRQIKEKKYTESLEKYTGNILLVGINYDKKTKEHQCLIENFIKQE